LFQQNEIKFDNLTIEHGLSQSVVESIVQDCIGFMWFGTQDGLNMYDGYKFTVYKNETDNTDSLCNNFIICLFEDSEKNLWIGTKNGLSRYNREKNCFINYKNIPGNKASLANNEIRAIHEDSNGELWIGTYGGGLHKFDSSKEKFSRFTIKEKSTEDKNRNRINAIHEDKKNNIFFTGTWRAGLYTFDRQNLKWDKIGFADSENADDIRINSITQDADGKIILSTNSGLYILNLTERTVTQLQHNPEDPFSLSNDLVSFSYIDSKNNLWIATREGGLNLLDTNRNAFIHFRHKKENSKSISNNSITKIFEDRSGIIWIGTYGGGVNKLINQCKKIQHFNFQNDSDNCVSSDKIYCFLEDEDDNLWIGTWDKGLNFFEKKTNKFKCYRSEPGDINSISNDTITGIVKDKNNDLWIGTSGGGLNKFDRRENKFIRFCHDPLDKNSLSHDTIFTIAIDSNDVLWIGTGGGGLDRYDIKLNKFSNYRGIDKNSISSNRVRTIFIDRNNIKWIGTDNSGLDRFDEKNNTFQNYSNKANDNSSLSSNNILSIYEDSLGSLWVGTIDGGLNKFISEKNSFKRYNARNGLPNNSVNGILEDEHENLWVSTNYGISKFNIRKEVFRNYDEKDGLQSNEFNQSACIKLKDGSLIFGGINGFNIFHPDGIHDNQFIPPVVISDFKIFNKSINVLDKNSKLKKPIFIEDYLDLSYRDSVISFEISVLDFNVPEKNRYAYKLEGFDRNWVYSGDRRYVTYTNLNPGNYVFRVKGSNNDLVWNEEGTSIGINISPPFWKTGWFKIMGALAAAGAGNAIYRSKLNKIKKEKKAQEEFTRKLIEFQENDRKKIAGELHDNIGHYLLITKNKLLLGEKKIDDKEFLKNNISEMSEILSETLKDVREMSYTLHPYQLERLGISKAIKSIADRAAKSSGITFTTNVDDIDKILNKDAEINLYRIIQECINNIIKHSNAAEAILNIIKSDRNISVLISDNGSGFDLNNLRSEKISPGYGLQGMKERTKLFNGQLKLESEIGVGTSITITIAF